jgi:hypothetical protein
LEFCVDDFVFGLHPVAASSVPQGLPGIAEAHAGSRDALYRKCRKMVFDKYSTYRMVSGMRRRILPSKFSIPTTDACVANGGHLS